LSESIVEAAKALADEHVPWSRAISRERQAELLKGS
jgi:hypothetical protein